jgi:hypothetical protein
MVQIVLVGFLPDDHGSCKAHPYGCGNALIEREGNGVGHLVCLRLVEKVHLACYHIKMDGIDGCRICFAAHEYASGETALLLDGLLLRITEVFLCDSPNKRMRALYHRKSGYMYVETVQI